MSVNSKSSSLAIFFAPGYIMTDAACQYHMSGKPGRSGGGNVKLERNEALVAYYCAGHSVTETAKAFNISRQRVGKLVRGMRPKPNHIRSQ